MQRVIGIVPLGIGLTLLVSLWSQPFGGFHSPPLFFRIFGSFVALFFVFMGGGLVFGSMANPDGLMGMLREAQRRQRELEAELREDAAPGPANHREPGGYTCTSCGAPLSGNADVSPHGDVKCSHCGRWFNIHQQT